LFYVGIILSQEFLFPVQTDPSHSVRFFQSKDEQGSLRAVGAFGLMSASASRTGADTGYRSVNQIAERTCLSDRLKTGGIPWVLASRVSEEFGSISQLDLLYGSVDDEECRDRLLAPVVADLSDKLQHLSGTPAGWSTAIHKVFFSALSDPAAGRANLEKFKHLVEDKAILLAKLHSGMQPEEALDSVLSSDQLEREACQGQVSIEVTPGNEKFFAVNQPGGPKFFALKVSENQPAVSRVFMRTNAGPYSSSRLCIFLLEGDDVMSRLREGLTEEQDFVSAARSMALRIRQDCCSKLPINVAGEDTSLVLIRGLHSALDKAAKGNGFPSEMRVLGM
jgi:hypothetical protein